MAAAVTEETINLIRKLPKTEIHLHFEGIASIDSIWSLVQRHSLDVGIQSKEELRRKFAVRSLDEFIDLFINVVQACIIDSADIDLLVKDTSHYLLRNNIRYAEIFFAPTSLLKNGIDFDSLIQRLSAGANYLRRYGVTVRYIVDVSRSFGFENALHNLNLTLQHKTNDIIGLGLGGSEHVGPPRDFVGVFHRAIEHGLKIVAHAGEVTGPETIRDSLNLLRVQRIGHGTSAYLDPHLMKKLREEQIPLEICPTSNIYTAKYVTDMKHHPIRTFYDQGLLVTVNSDDPTIFGTDLSDEYIRLLQAGVFSLEEIVILIRNGIFATFLPEAEKLRLWNQVKETLIREDVPALVPAE